MSEDADTPALFRQLIGPDNVETGPGTRAFAIDEQPPQCVLFPNSVADVSACVRAGSEAGLAIIPVGNGTKLGIGRVPHRYDVALSTRRLRRLLRHEAADMTVSVEAGGSLAELNAALAAAGQRLPLDPPDPEHTSIGALIATDAAGPLRLSQGKVRDLLIGIKVVLADGTIVSGGGRVVKNVAGYDLMKLFTGSFGTLGVIVEANFKVRPRPESEAIFVVPAATTAEACILAGTVLAARLAPQWIEVVNQVTASALGIAQSAAVVLGCAGTPGEIAGQERRLRDDVSIRDLRTHNPADGGGFSTALRDFPDSVLVRTSLPLQMALERYDARGSTPISQPASSEHKLQLWRNVRQRLSADICGCKLSLLPSKLTVVLPDIEREAADLNLETALLVHAGNGIALCCFRGAAVTDGAFPQFAGWLRTAVRAAGGWAVFDPLPLHLKPQIDPWDADVPALALMRSIKQTLDPKHHFSPGRFVGGI